MIPRIIAVAMQKGGVGKTTTAVSLAACLAEVGRSVLLIDCDAQAASASDWVGCREASPNLFHVLTGQALARLAVHPAPAFGFDVLPANGDMIAIDLYLGRQTMREGILRKALKKGLGQAYDYILLDCPPNLDLVTVNALAAAGEVLVPVCTHYLSSVALAELVGTIHSMREEVNPGLCLAGVVACQHRRGTRSGLDVLAEVRGAFGEQAYATAVPVSVALTDAPGKHLPITVFAPASAGAVAYRALAAEVVAQEGN